MRAVGLQHFHQHARVAVQRDGLDGHAGAGSVGLVQPHRLLQLLQAVQVGAFAHRLEGIILEKHPVPHRVQDLLLGLEMVVDRAFGQAAQLVHNVLDGGVVVAFFQKKPLGRVQNAFHRHFRVFVARHICPLRVVPPFTFSWYVSTIPDARPTCQGGRAQKQKKGCARRADRSAGAGAVLRILGMDAGGRYRRAATAAFSASARSVFSHLTPRSSRPMWP